MAPIGSQNDRAQGRAWVKARRQDTPEAYFDFVSRFPENAHAPEARARQEDLAWRRRCEEDTLSGYESHLRAFAQGAHGEQARARIREIEAENRTVAESARRPLAGESGCRIWVEERLVRKPRKWQRVLVIAIHVSKGYSPTDAGPTIEGGYRSRGELRSLIERRVAETYRAVLPSVEGLRLDEVEVEVRHGVWFQRVDAYGRPLPPSQEDREARVIDRVLRDQGIRIQYLDGVGGESPTTLYRAGIRLEGGRGRDWARMGDEALRKAWVAYDSIGSIRVGGC